MRALETSYKGYRFRSRLEARWAVLFDRLHLTWAYEPEGYELRSGALYLPDFVLRTSASPFGLTSLFVEVKPTLDAAQSHAERLAEFGKSVSGDKSTAFLLVVGDPCEEVGYLTGSMRADGKPHDGHLLVSHVFAVHFRVPPESYRLAALVARTARFESMARIGEILASLSR